MITINTSGIKIDPALVAGEPVAVKVEGLQFDNEAKPILIVTSRFPDRIVATSEPLTETRETTEGSWELVEPLTTEQIEALAVQGFSVLAPVTVERSDAPMEDALKIGEYSVAVRVEDGKAYYLGGDFILDFHSGDLVATYTEGTDTETGVWTGSIDLATIEVGQMFCHARADEKLAASVELVDAHNRKSMAQITVPIRNSALLLARLHGIHVYVEAVEQLREAFGELDSARPLTAGETALRVQQIVNALQSI